MAAINSNEVESTSQQTFELKWVIKNWKDVVRNESLTENTKMEFPLEAENIVYGKVLVGTSMFQNANRSVGIYWKLLSKHYYLENIQANLVTEILNYDGKVTQTFENKVNAVVGTTMEIRKSFWCRTNPDSSYATYTNSEGSLEIKLKITLINLPDLISLLKSQAEFGGICRDEICNNLATLLDDKMNSDVKILTKDKIEHFAHKIILRAQCPVFASMFGSDFIESNTGVVDVDDISVKTMKILLTYWYTGELLPSWKDDDTIVEFTYAAGKYQITPILKLLDDVLGRGSCTPEIEVELLKMVQKLSLKNAEGRILKRVIHEISKIKSGAKLLRIFYQESDILEETILSPEQILEVWNDIIGENDDTHVRFQNINLLAFACKLGMKNVEKQLLQCIVNAVCNVGNADELFEIFELQNEDHDSVSVTEGSKSLNLLVRATSKS